MKLPGEWMPSLELGARLGFEASVVLTLALVGSSVTKVAAWQRTLWQAAFLGVLVCSVGEVIGLPGMLLENFSARRAPALASSLIEAPSHAPETDLSLRENFKAQVWQALQQQRASALRTAADEAEPFFAERVLPWPGIVWFFGTTTVVGVALLARVYLWALRWRWRAVADQEVRVRTCELARQIGIKRWVRVLEAERLCGPIALGVIWPVVVVPRTFGRTYTPKQQAVMLAHELSHLAARDPAWQLLADVVTASLWWHPLMWWARGRFRSTCELAADEGSLLLAQGPNVLAECLLALASRLTDERPRIGLGVTGFRSSLGRRIERLLRLKGDWTPLDRRHSVALRVLFPGALLAALTLCSAWVGPQNKGESMHIIQTWRRSMATFALVGAFGAEHGHSQTPAALAQHQAPPPAEVSLAADVNSPSPEADRGQLLEDARLLLEMGKLDQAEAKLQGLLQKYPNNKKALRYLDQIRQKRASGSASAAEQAAPVEEVETQAPPPAPAQSVPAESAPFGLDPRLAARYGLVQNGNPNSNQNQFNAALAQRYGLKVTNGVSAPQPVLSRGKQQVEAKLNQIVLNEVLYDNLPLTEVVRDLNDQARRRDPEKKGINILISNVPADPVPTGIDPTTGMPIMAAVADLTPATIRLHLRDVRLKDVFDAMTKVADRPLRYSVEDYGVIFYPGVGPVPPPVIGGANRSLATAHLQVRTFHVDKETFLPGLESAFGIAVGRQKPAADENAQELELELRNLEQRLHRIEQLHANAAISEDEFAKAKSEVDVAKARVKAAAAGKTDHASGPREIQQALRELLRQLGVNMDVPNKAVFYNDLTGIVMVRATAEDLELVQAAIETLGGKMLKPTTASVLGDLPVVSNAHPELRGARP